MEKKPCGLPPKFPVNSALRAKNDIIEVPDSAVFKCREIGKVTDLGKSIDIQVPAILLTFSSTFYATERFFAKFKTSCLNLHLVWFYNKQWDIFSTRALLSHCLKFKKQNNFFSFF